MPLLRALAAVTAVLLLSALPVASASAQQKGLPGYCPDTNGVNVVVDYGDLGGDVVVRCAPGEQASGLAAMQNAGFEVAGTQRFGLASTCRIDGRPAPDVEPCIDLPPMTAFWTYWSAPAGGAWAQAQTGAMDAKPQPGAFEGWVFAKDRTLETSPAPRVAPVPQAVAPPVTSTPPPAEDGGFPWGAVLGAVVLVLVGGAAGFTAWRRKRSSD